MERGSKTKDTRQLWITLALVVGLSAFFGLVALPMFKPKAVLEGRPAPDFALGVIHGGDPGNRFRLSDQKGGVVVLDFWASWCAPCRKQIPVLDALAKKHPDWTIVGVATDDTLEKATAYAKAQKLSYVAVHDGDSAVAAGYRVRALPTLVVVSPKGKVTAMKTRVVQAEELEQLVVEAASQ